MQHVASMLLLRVAVGRMHICITITRTGFGIDCSRPLRYVDINAVQSPVQETHEKSPHDQIMYVSDGNRHLGLLSVAC